MVSSAMADVSSPFIVGMAAISAAFAQKSSEQAADGLRGPLTTQVGADAEGGAQDPEPGA